MAVVVSSGIDVSYIQSPPNLTVCTIQNTFNYPIMITGITIRMGVGTRGSYFYQGDVVHGTGTNFTFTVSGGGSSDSKYISTPVSDNGAGLPIYSQTADYTFNLTVRINSGESVTFSGIKDVTNTVACFDRSNYPGNAYVAASYLPVLTGSFSVDGTETTILYDESGNLSSTYSSNISSPIVSYTYTLLSGSASISSSTISNVRSRCQVKVTGTLTKSNYYGSLTATDTFYVECKLNYPTLSTILSTGGLTIGTSVPSTGLDITPSSEPVLINYNNNPEECTAQYQVSVDEGEWSTISTPYTITEGEVIKFRANLSKTDYITSEYSENTEDINIYYEPRLMESNGFNYNFKYIEVGTTDEVELPIFANDGVVVPTSTLVVNWGSFLPSKNLGRFNRYAVLMLVDTSTGEELYNSGILVNNPSTNNHKHTFNVNPVWAGKTCVIKLECTCKWPDSTEGSLYGPADTAIFVSRDFFIGGFPKVPEVKYPSITGFYSSNNRLRLIFKVTNPDYFLFEQITNVSVEISRQGYHTSVYTYKNNREMFWSINPVPSTDPLDNGTLLDFTVPEEYVLDTNTKFRINCSNRYLTSDWTDYYTLTMLPLEMMVNNRKLLRSDLIDVKDSPVKVLLGYTNYPSGVSSYVDVLPEQTPQGDYKVQNNLYITNTGVINRLHNLYKEVSKDSLPPKEFRLNLNNIDIITKNDLTYVDAETEFIYSTEVGSFIPIGNYFNFIIYIMKNML